MDVDEYPEGIYGVRASTLKTDFSILNMPVTKQIVLPLHSYKPTAMQYKTKLPVTSSKIKISSTGSYLN
jgi:hypothetical protein